MEWTDEILNYKNCIFFYIYNTFMLLYMYRIINHMHRNINYYIDR